MIGALKPKTLALAALVVAMSFTATRPVGAAAARPRLKLVELARADAPVGVLAHPTTGMRYVIEKGGHIRALTANGLGDTVLDVHDNLSTATEQGLLGAAFSPDGAWLYTDLTDRAGNTLIEARRFDGRAVGEPVTLIKVDQPYPNHNGGQLVVTADGVLWIGLGDGGAAGDPQGNALNRSSLLGKILRILPTPLAEEPYTIPDGNLKAALGGSVRPEIWAFGLRNPWRFSIDGATVWIGDVGQDSVEEIDALPLSTVGANFGWSNREGTRAYKGRSRPRGAIEPVYEYTHRDGGCSVTGGYVYRGSGIPSLRGHYVFADFCKGVVQAIAPGTRRAFSLGVTVDHPSSFGVDGDGALYVTSLDGPVYRIDPA